MVVIKLGSPRTESVYYGFSSLPPNQVRWLMGLIENKRRSIFLGFSSMALVYVRRNGLQKLPNINPRPSICQVKYRTGNFVLLNYMDRIIFYLDRIREESWCNQTIENHKTLTVIRHPSDVILFKLLYTIRALKKGAKSVKL